MRKEIGFFRSQNHNCGAIYIAYPEYENKKICDFCAIRFNIEIKKKVKNGLLKSCYDCGYCETITHERGGVDDLGMYIDESYSTYKCRKFSLEIDSNPIRAHKCTSYISAKEYQEKCLRREQEKEKANVQIILDFSSLKDVMSKGGLVMTTCKCPNCSGMVDIPETGKVLMCKYCGSPIKPVDIFDKIKTLIQ
jgi:hypothetical protein